jgi:endonuclease III
LEAFPFDKVLKRLEEYYGEDSPALTRMASEHRDPFLVLIACLLSLRTKDEVTDQAMSRLLARARRPKEVAAIAVEELEKIIYPVGFYRNKARILRDISQTVIEVYKGRVPNSMEELLKLKGVGRKTANIVLTEGFQLPGIAVDTHVHRISNRFGAVLTRAPDETENALRRSLPTEYWIRYNALLVTHGRRTCTPVSPFCSRCPVFQYCKRIGVKKSR